MAVAIASNAIQEVERSQVVDEKQVNERGIGRRLREVILGGQDGLVNVLGLVLGIAAATAQTRVIMVAGLAATVWESIAMAGVANTSALADRDYKLSRLRLRHWPAASRQRRVTSP